jgi:hypothetical protein
LVWQAAGDGRGHPLALEPIATEAMLFDRRPRAELMDEFNRALIGAAEQIGNIQFQAITIGVCPPIGGARELVVAVLRGQYDSRAAGRLIRKHQPQPSPGYLILTPDDHRLILVSGVAFGPLPGIPGAADGGNGTLRDSPDLAPMLKRVDMTQPIWGVGQLTPFRGNAEAIFGPFKTLTLGSTVDGGELHLKLTAMGNDPEGAKRSVAQMKNDLTILLGRARPFLITMPVGRPVLKVLESIEAQSDGGSATISARVPRRLLDEMLKSGSSHATQPAP